MSIKLCDYGCGKEAKYQFKNGKWWTSFYQEIIRRKNIYKINAKNV